MVQKHKKFIHLILVGLMICYGLFMMTLFGCSGDTDVRLTLDIQGNGLVRVNGQNYLIDAVIAFEENSSVSYSYSETTTGWTFSHWGGNFSGTSSSNSFTINEDKTLIAIFTENKITLSGTITYDNKPVSDIVINADGYTNTTNNNGVYTIIVPIPSDKIVSVYIIAEGKTVYQRDVLIKDSTYNYTVDHQLSVYNHSLKANTSGLGKVYLVQGIIQQELTASFSFDAEHGFSGLLIAVPEDGYQFCEWQGDLTSFSEELPFTLTASTSITAAFHKTSDSITNIYTQMKDLYYWSDTMLSNSFDYTSYTSTQTVFNAMIYTEDSFSAIQSKEAYDLSQRLSDYGFVLDSSNRIRLIFPNSPADLISNNKPQRGDTILKINNQSVTELNAKIKPDTMVQMPVKFKNSANQEIQILLNKGTPDDYSSSIYHQVIENNNKKIGYLVFNRFNSRATAQLQTIFKEFESSSIDDIILDIRDTFENDLEIATLLASYIVGNQADITSDTPFLTRHYHPSKNTESLKFSKLDYALAMEKVVFIISPFTGFAGEALIHGLKPHAELTIIGTEIGSPNLYEMASYEECSIHFTFVSNQLSNADGQVLTTSTTVNCNVSDNISIDFGDFSENGLKAALEYIDTNTCPASQKEFIEDRFPLLTITHP